VQQQEVLFGRVAALQCAALFAVLKRTNLWASNSDFSLRSRGLNFKVAVFKKIALAEFRLCSRCPFCFTSWVSLPEFSIVNRKIYYFSFSCIASEKRKPFFTLDKDVWKAEF